MKETEEEKIPERNLVNVRARDRTRPHQTYAAISSIRTVTFVEIDERKRGKAVALLAGVFRLHQFRNSADQAFSRGSFLK